MKWQSVKYSARNQSTHRHPPTGRLVPFPLIVAAVVAAGSLLSACQAEPPAPGSDEYRELVGSFYVGVAAMETGVDARAFEEFEEVGRLAPGEPAAWANLALLAMRRNELVDASDYMSRAMATGVASSHVTRLAGRLALLDGRTEEALAAFMQAAEIDSSDLRADYAAAQVLDRDLGRSGEAEVLLRRIVDRAPRNLAAYVELLRLSAASGDAEAVLEAVTSVPFDIELWPVAAVEQFGGIREALASAGTDGAATKIAFLRNVLVRTPQYRSSLQALQPRVEDVDEVMNHFTVIDAPQQAPSPSDSGVRFSVATGSVVSGPNDFVATTLLIDELAPAAVVVRGDTALVEGGGVVGFPLGENGETMAHPITRADFNYDFSLDLALVGAGGVRIYLQDSSRIFHDRTQLLGLSRDVLTGTYVGAWPVDFDLEGDVDLVLGRTSGPPTVLRNRGDETFEVVALFEAVDGLRGFAWADLDLDGDPDAVLLDGAGAVHVFANERSAQFRPWRVWKNDGDPALGVGVADVDGDAIPEIVVLRRSGVLMLEAGTERSRLLTASPGVPSFVRPGEAHIFLRDVDNNGGLDILVSWPSTSAVFLQEHDRSFRLLTDDVGARILDVEDVDGDGRLDLIGLDLEGRAVRLQNSGTADYHWKEIRPRAATALGDQRINSLALGGEIELRSGLLFQKRLIEGPTVHFGLGEHSVADVARIIWPNGDVQVEFDLLSGQLLLAQQRLKGSCPWLFTYDGARMRFVTDFIWRSPLGMRINAQETAGIATTEDWVLVPGELLRPRENTYDVRITAELWETHFFDHVSLVTVDHAEGTHVFVDERFAVPPPAFEVHVTSELRELVSAHDQDGRDVGALLAGRDQQYVGSFRRGFYQGVADDHFVEIEFDRDIGAATDPVLVASGWIRPTDSSINVAIAQGSADPPSGLRIEVLDRQGAWITTDDNLGFPSGKEKTVILSLRRALETGAQPLRIRLRTNLEVYWDRAVWADRLSREQAVAHRQLASRATLQYRGFSVVETADRDSPELPDYETLQGTAPVWQDLAGYYTRYGDVSVLLERVDDRYVIMNAGDELRLEFGAGAPPPPGTIRDFVLVGDGWVKDGDFNTVASKTVLPLPRHGDVSYSDDAVSLETDPVYQLYRDDWSVYHTRYIAPDRFRRALLPD